MSHSPRPLDQLLAVLKTPSLASDLALRAEDWSEIKRLAEIHRFSGALAYATSAWLPASERKWRDQVLMSHHQRHAHRLQALRRITEAFRVEGVACVSLKGPLLAERFYTEPFLRPSNDLDLLIYEKDVGSAARIMRSLGFPLEGRHPWNTQRRVSQHLNYSATGSSPRVEVHYYLLAGGGFFLEASGFMDRRRTWQSPAGFEASVLSNADEAFYTCMHAATHGFHRLRWLYDLIAIARVLKPEERMCVRQLAVRHGQSGHFFAAAIAAREFFGETPDLGCSGLPVPWTHPTARQIRRMVERVEGNTASLRQKAGYRLDLFRMTQSPWQAVELLACFADREMRRLLCQLRPVDPGALARTLPD